MYLSPRSLITHQLQCQMLGLGFFSGVTLIDRKEIGAMVDRSDGMIDDRSLITDDVTKRLDVMSCDLIMALLPLNI